jgi:ABC-type glycerol-3-phosphate transport system substrate-binding protein
VKFWCSSLVVAALLLGNAYAAHAQTEITLLVPGPMGRETVDKLIAGFESETGDKVKATYGQGSQAARGARPSVGCVHHICAISASGRVRQR